MSAKKACKDCLYCRPYYGNKKPDGNVAVSKYRCTKRGFIKRFPKQCDTYKRKEA